MVKTIKIHKMQKGSVYTGSLPAGCRICGKGRKLVLFITGKCYSGCYYCPLSDSKKNKDVVFANELNVKRSSDIIREATLIGADGTGVTGGDPLLFPERTARLIRLLKKEFGDTHHVHLYTANTSEKRLKMIIQAGLDEIRFHPPPNTWQCIQKTPYLKAIETASEGGVEVGVEIPAVPGFRKETESLITSLFSQTTQCPGVTFVNLNELEFSETNADALKKRGFTVKDCISSGVNGSESMAYKIISKMSEVYGSESQISLHYCSAGYKDGVQLRNRIKRRANSIARPSDIITKDGLLLKGIVEGSIHRIKSVLTRTHRVPAKYIYADRRRGRVEVAPWILQKIARKLTFPAYIVEEYPTADRLEVERMRIN